MTLAERIQKLSPQQQARLWDRLNEAGSGTNASSRETGSAATSNPPAEHGSKKLLAYVVLRPGRSVPETELKQFLQPAMLEFMVPNHFVFLNALPLTPNGKVDRNALPAFESNPAQAPAAFVAPRSPTEEALARAWAEVLRLPSVSVHDDFFQLGGHSLLALQVMGRVRETFKADLPLRTLFDFPTVAGLAAVIDKTPKSSAAEPIKRIARDFAVEPNPVSNQP